MPRFGQIGLRDVRPEEPERFAVDAMTRSTYALHFYDSVLVIEKRPMEPPRKSMTGKPSF